MTFCRTIEVAMYYFLIELLIVATILNALKLLGLLPIPWGLIWPISLPIAWVFDICWFKFWGGDDEEVDSDEFGRHRE